MKLSSGFNLDRYKIGEFLASGSTADVYSCYPANETAHSSAERHRYVAKVFKLPSDLAQYDRRKRLFYKEIETIERLNTNIHIVRILEQGHFIDPEFKVEIPYCVLPRLTGGTLTHQIKDAPLSVEDALKIGIGLADALYYAHENGILHCDVKPDNVMLDSSKNPVWIDFGVAKDYTPSGEGASVMSEVGKVAVGTAPYMSPEHFRGRHSLCPASDIWSMGALLTRILTKKFPFGKEFEQVRQNIKSRTWVDFADLMQDAPHELAQIPVALQRVLDKCLRVNLNERYTSALALKQDLEAVLRGHTPLLDAKKNTAQEQIPSSIVQIKPWQFLLGGLSLLGVLAYFLIPLFLSAPPKNQVTRAKSSQQLNQIPTNPQPQPTNPANQIPINPQPQPNNPANQIPTNPQPQPINPANQIPTNPQPQPNNTTNPPKPNENLRILVQFVPQSGYNPQKTRINGESVNPNIGLMQPFEAKMGQNLSWEIETPNQELINKSIILPKNLSPNQIIRVNWQTGFTE